jgi:hypothetical protein
MPSAGAASLSRVATSLAKIFSGPVASESKLTFFFFVALRGRLPEYVFTRQIPIPELIYYRRDTHGAGKGWVRMNMELTVT